MRVHRILPILFAALLCAAAVGRAQPNAGYKVVQKVLLGGEGGWDYLLVDAAARRLYVTRGTHVSVFDADTLKPVGEIENTAGVHGVALAPELGRGYVSNGRASSITIFDLKTLKTLEEVKSTGENPDAILYDPASTRVFAFNGRSANATVLDAASGKVLATVALGGKPEFATSDQEGRVYANLEDRSELVAIDSRKAEVLKHWPLAPCEEPTGMAIDRAHKRLFIGCGNRLMVVVNAATGNIVASVPIGAGVDATGFDPDTALAFSSNGEGTLTVVREDAPDKFSVVENVATQRGARTMALDEKTHRVFLVTAEFGPAPEATAGQPRPRPPILPGTFTLLVVGR
ncbi:MAG TPA: YncE family protein [Thermoanaerobaculia bacterium]|nr:YncE family protein [Thermoanaerobaculia bacterium]